MMIIVAFKSIVFFLLRQLKQQKVKHLFPPAGLKTVTKHDRTARSAHSHVTAKTHTHTEAAYASHTHTHTLEDKLQMFLSLNLKYAHATRLDKIMVHHTRYRIKIIAMQRLM